MKLYTNLRWLLIPDLHSKTSNRHQVLLKIKIIFKFFLILTSFRENALRNRGLGKELISICIFWVTLPPSPNFQPLAEVHACWKLKCLHCRMGHYNSTHAALVEKMHVFGIALLQVRNVKQSSYFRWKWEPELFLNNPTRLSSNEGEKSLCTKAL